MSTPLHDSSHSLIELDPNFSTTRRLTQNRPNIKPHPHPTFQSLLLLPEDKPNKKHGGLRTQGYFKRSFTATDQQSSQISLPLVTVITVVFNGEKYLEQTIESVINQDYSNIEYLVIDGGSTDRTLEIIQQYADKIDYWISEADDGLYDAMNKGLLLSTGDIIGIINSDDAYVEQAVSKIVEKFNQYQDTKEQNKLVFCGSMFGIDEESKIKCKIDKPEKVFNSRVHKTMPVNHPATFVCSEVYANVGLFNTDYKIAADYDLIYRIYAEKAAKFILMNEGIACMRASGVSNQLSSLWIKAKERYLIRKGKLSLSKNIWFSLEITLIEALKRLLRPILNDNLLSIYYRYREQKNNPNI